jgi:hypothetical protein
LKEIRWLIRDNKTSDFLEDSQGTLWLGKRICVPNVKHIKELSHEKLMTQPTPSIPVVPRCTRI